MTKRKYVPIILSGSNLNGGAKRKRICCKKIRSLVDSDSEPKIRSDSIMEQNQNRNMRAERREGKNCSLFQENENR